MSELRHPPHDPHIIDYREYFERQQQINGGSQRALDQLRQEAESPLPRIERTLHVEQVNLLPSAVRAALVKPIPSASIERACVQWGLLEQQNASLAAVQGGVYDSRSMPRTLTCWERVYAQDECRSSCRFTALADLIQTLGWEENNTLWQDDESQIRGLLPSSLTRIERVIIRWPLPQQPNTQRQRVYLETPLHVFLNMIQVSEQYSGTQPITTRLRRATLTDALRLKRLLTSQQASDVATLNDILAYLVRNYQPGQHFLGFTVRWTAPSTRDIGEHGIGFQSSSTQATVIPFQPRAIDPAISNEPDPV